MCIRDSYASFRLAERSQGALAEFSTLNFNLLRHLQIATANTAKNPPKSTPILAFDCDRRSCMLAQDPPLPRHPPRAATPPGECGRARLARERAARPPRALRSHTRARRQPRVTSAGPWQQQQRAPWQQPAPPRPRRGCGEVVRPSRGARSALRLPPGRAPAPRSSLTLSLIHISEPTRPY